MAISGRQPKNIWVAAGDGDLSRVRELVELHSVSPNGPDENSYTPMHAAASYGHIEVLEYLVSKGGDVNVTDEDGDTPLYTVETLETARYLVDRGAIVDRVNNEGISPIEHLSEDFQAVAGYLQSRSSLSTPLPLPSNPKPSQHSQDVASEQLTSTLMESVQAIMQQAGQTGQNVDAALHQAVTRAVLDGVSIGFQFSDQSEERVRNQAPGDGDGSTVKRPRTN